jgi:CBS domain-containing protein
MDLSDSIVFCLPSDSLGPMRKLRHIIFEQHPVVLNRSATVLEACREMRRTSAGSVVVVNDDGRLVGIFTARDAVPCSRGRA